MKNTKVIAVAIVVIIVIAILVLIPATKNKSVSPSSVVNSGQKPTTAPITATVTSSGYSPELKAKVRTEFINTCHTKGNYSIAVCTCGADYLASNYSESDLAKMYLQYHTTNVVPKALEIAADKCTK